MAKKKATVTAPGDQGVLKAKSTEARELTDKVKALADVSGANLIEIGLLCRQFTNEPDLYKSLNFNTYDQWRDDTFAGKKTSAQTSKRIVDTLLPNFTKEEILTWGRVKAVAYCRLPESEQLKDEWKKFVREDDATSFKARVKAFIGGKDHREGFCTISFPAPISFRDTTYNRVVERGKLVEQTTDSFIVMEAALASYEQQMHEDNPTAFADGALPCFVRVESTQAARDAIGAAVKIAMAKTGKAADVTVLSALNYFNG